MADEDPRLDAIERSLSDLAAGFNDLREASTAAEKKAAREDIEDAEDEIERLAKQAGVHPDAIRKARQDAEYARLKPHIERYLEELPAPKDPADDPDPDPPAPDSGGGKKKEPKADKPPASPKAATAPDSDPSAQDPPPAAPTPDDSGPTHPHWSERGIGELIR